MQVPAAAPLRWNVRRPGRRLPHSTVRDIRQRSDRRGGSGSTDATARCVERFHCSETASWCRDTRGDCRSTSSRRQSLVPPAALHYCHVPHRSRLFHAPSLLLRRGGWRLRHSRVQVLRHIRSLRRRRELALVGRLAHLETVPTSKATLRTFCSACIFIVGPRVVQCDCSKWSFCRWLLVTPKYLM